ncbi:hypothetical protein IW249_000073 [Micromonospora vinacea]|uniref:Secreted protein n=1 Tax=Micromonospora vinacea TaxID=709878 RepID=A0ABS0JTH9_9ACTN|nr:hypothetical protein [Micromonospora vinacea]MBG6099659.1 hypothetical protein [Micromonospora vinacea]
MRRLVEGCATFAVPAGAWCAASPVLHNVLLTLVGDRLSGDVPLSGGVRLARWWARGGAEATTSMFERDQGGPGATQTSGGSARPSIMELCWGTSRADLGKSGTTTP